MNQQQIFAGSLKIFALFKLSFRAVKCKQENESVVSYIESSIKGGENFFHIGSREGDYLYIMRRRLGKSGKIVAFETEAYLLQRLNNLKRILSWKNVDLEALVLSDNVAVKLQ